MLKHYFKGILALMLALTLALGCICLNADPVFAKKTVYSFGSGSYTIISEQKKTVQYEGLSERSYTVADIPCKAEINGKSYKVTQIADNALANADRVKKAVISEDITKIGKKAFYNCKNLTKITIKTEHLTKSSVGTNAFKGLNAKAVITVPKQKLDSYKTILKSKGLKNQTVKGTAQNSNADSDSASSGLKYNASFDLSKSLFESDICFSRISASDDGIYTSEISAGDTVSIKTKFGFKPGIYGHWEEDSRRLVKGYVQCLNCGKCFSDYMLAFHDEMELEEGGCGYGHYLIGSNKIQQPTTWAFIPDKTPCQAVVKYTLPSGISYKNGSMKVSRWMAEDDYTDACKINVSGNTVTVTIDDVKKSPFYNAFNYEAYKKDLYYRPSSLKNEDDYHAPFLVKFDVTTDSHLSSDSIISTDISYSYKGTGNTESYKALIRTASLQVSNTDTENNSITGAEFDLYQKRANMQDKGHLKSTDWKLFKSGIHAGDTVTGLGTGTMGFEDNYKLVQTKVPDGYEEMDYDAEFVLAIEKNGKVSAVDENGNALETEGSTVKVTAVNRRNTYSPAASASVNTGNSSSKANEADTASGNQESVKNNDIPENTTGILAVYFEDGVKECSMKRFEKADEAGMIPTKSVSYREYKFEGCHLEKLTLNGEEIDSIPDKVKNGSTICFYYVTNN